MNARIKLLFLAILASIPCGSVFSTEFDKQLALEGVTFHVQTEEEIVDSVLKITLSGEYAGTPLVRLEVPGTVANIDVADLDGSGTPILFIFVRSSMDNARMTLVAYAANRNKSLTPVILPDITEDLILGADYAGHDFLALQDGCLVDRFPLFRKGIFLGSFREVRYKLQRGGTGWSLQPVDIIEYAGS